MTFPFFDAAYYLARNPDVAKAGFTAETAHLHYLKHGAAELRAPAPWFDGAAYMQANPDLAAHGVTAATVFSHFVNYGIHEGRAPSPTFDPTKFNYAAYAGAYADLRAVFGISDAQAPTPEQQEALWAHFLGYGVREGRFPEARKDNGEKNDDGGSEHKSGGDDHTSDGEIVPEVKDRTIVVDTTGGITDYKGDSGNDLFTAEAGKLNHAVLNGNGGHDVLQATLSKRMEHVDMTSIETAEFHLVDKSIGLKIEGEGLKTMEITFNTEAASTLHVWGGAAFGDKLNVILCGGKEGLAAGFSVYLPSDDYGIGSDRHDLNVDGSAVRANQTFEFRDVAQNAIVSVIGGAGDDVFVASYGTDTLKGGEGNDVFKFSAETSLAQMAKVSTGGREITAMDTIADFQNGDKLHYTAFRDLKPEDIALDKVGTIKNNILTIAAEFASGKEITALVTGIEAAGYAEEHTTLACVFDFDNDAYFLDSAQSGSLGWPALIKLAGVSSTELKVLWSASEQAFDISYA